MKSENSGYAVWRSNPDKTAEEAALLAPCVPLEFLLDDDSEPNGRVRNFYRPKMPRNFTDSAIFYSLWTVFDTLGQPRVAAILDERQRVALRAFRSSMESLPWKTVSNFEKNKELIGDNLTQLIEPGKALYEALKETSSELNDASNEDSAVAPPS